jgi:hypothetical protein
VTSEPIAIELALTFAGDSPSGGARLSDATHERRFCGWLGLLAAIDALRAEAEDQHPSPHSRTPPCST